MPRVNSDFLKVKTDLTKAAADIGKAAQDAAYVAIGLGVLSFQRAQVRRREVLSQLEGLQEQIGNLSRLGETPVADRRKELARLVTDLDKTVGQLIERWDAAVDPVYERLPSSAQTALQQARDARDQLRGYLVSLAA
jgi:methyl-accepting chemotaxis protein